MSSFPLALSVLFMPAVFAGIGNWIVDPPTTPPTPPSINYRAVTFVITTPETVTATSELSLPPDYIEEQRPRAISEERQVEHTRWKKHRQFAGQCQIEKYVKIKDELGCEMCTCIYEKSIMLCSPYECIKHEGGLVMEEVGSNLYNDYIINAPTHFSEYKCAPGEVLLPSALCDCTCVAKDILSCPPSCQFGRPLY